MLGDKDFTREFRHSSIPTLTGARGMRVITYTTKIWTDNFIPNSQYDGQKLKCEAIVADFKANITEASITVHCK